jgi:hypothetical protein
MTTKLVMSSGASKTIVQLAGLDDSGLIGVNNLAGIAISNVKKRVSGFVIKTWLTGQFVSSTARAEKSISLFNNSRSLFGYRPRTLRRIEVAAAQRETGNPE